MLILDQNTISNCICLISKVKESGLILLQTVPKQIEVSKLKEDLVSEIPGVANVHELHIWKLSGTKIIATAHVTCHTSTEYMKVAADIKEFFHKKGIHSTTIQPEFSDVRILLVFFNNNNDLNYEQDSSIPQDHLIKIIY